MKNYILIFLAQFISYFLIVVNTRAYTNNNYGLTAISDMIFSILSFYLIKKIANEANNFKSLCAYILGGTLGSLLSMYISQTYLNN